MLAKQVILNIVTDEQLLVSIIAGTTIIMAAIFGIFLNVYNLTKKNKQRNKAVRIVLLAIFIGIIILLFPEVRSNYSLYKNNKTISGKVIGFCKTSRGDDAVSFEYSVDGKTYNNCNSYFPFPKDSIKINSSYPIRVDVTHPESGRIVFVK